jgi:hypothetical protein
VLARTTRHGAVGHQPAPADAPALEHA